MRYYLDTNILVFILLKEEDEIDNNVASIIHDYSSILYVSSVAVKELLLLFRIGKVRSKIFKSEKDLLSAIQKLNIEIIFFNHHHLNTYAAMQIQASGLGLCRDSAETSELASALAALQITNAHKDMNDHAIISQAISDKVHVISSDAKFKDYTNQGLKFVFNRR